MNLMKSLLALFLVAIFIVGFSIADFCYSLWVRLSKEQTKLV